MNYQKLLEKLIQDLPSDMVVSATTYKLVMPNWWTVGLISVGIIIAFIALCMWIMPMYSVWASKKRGQAELAEANFAEQVAIAEATARKNSAQLNREAEVIDAMAVSDSIDKIGSALEKNEGYLRWQWIKSLSETKNEIIYVPTEANLPILEASRISKSTEISEE